MTTKTFVLTVSCKGDGHPINFNVITPDGDYKSGSRLHGTDQHALDKCLNELKSSIRAWNDFRDDKFPISPPKE